MRFSDEFLDSIRRALSVSEVVGDKVDLKRKGSEYVGLSPFQQEKSPSFTVSDEKGFYHCFSSGKHGDIFAWVQEMDGVDFPAAVEALASRAGIPMPGRRPQDSGPRRPQVSSRDDTPPFVAGDDVPPISAYEADMAAGAPRPERKEITRTYDYTDKNGELLYQVCRLEWQESGKQKKTFLQRRPSGDGGWIWGLRDGAYVQARSGDWYQLNKDREKWKDAPRATFPAVPHGLYRLAELREEADDDSVIVIPEGEKDVETWRSWGAVATTNSGGARHWTDAHADEFRGRHVVLPIDNDEAGRDRANIIGRSLCKHGAKSVRIVDFTDFWADAPKGADTTDWATAFAEKYSGTKAAAYLIANAKPWTPPPLVSKFGGITFEQLDEPGPEHQDVIDSWLTVGDKSVIGGASKSGKSFLAIHMSMCIATGHHFYGNKVLLPGLVIYQAGEGGRGIRKRFRAWRQSFDMPQGRIPLYILQSKVDIHSADGDTAKLIDEVKAVSDYYGMPVRALFIDTLAKASGAADENSGRDMGVVLANVDKVADALPGANICLVHHMNAGGTKLRGHTSVYANSDQIILVTRDEETNVRTAVLDKQKDGEDGLEISFELMQVEVGRRAIDGKPITSCITVPAGQKTELRLKGKGPGRTINLSQSQQLIFNSLKKAVEEYGIDTPPDLNLPRAIKRVCKVKDWKVAYLAVADNLEDNSVNAALRRASEKFLNLRIIGRVNPYVWLTDRAVSVLPEPLQGSTAAGPAPQAEFDDELDFSTR